MSTQSALAEPEAPAAVTELALVDLSSIAHPIWHMSGNQPDPDYCCTQIVSRIRALCANHPKAAICCDSGRSFRNELSPAYKANRPEREAALHHQIDRAKEILASDGFPVWCVRGFEADDLIATACGIALQMADVTVLVLSADKDLLQLVTPRVRVMSVNNGNVYDEAAVKAKFGIAPAQMRDYLTLVGDSSDNVKGAVGIGPKRAAELLARYGSLDAVYAALDAHGTQFKPAMATALREFQPRLEETRQLIALRADVNIPFIEIDTERTPKDVTPLDAEEPMEQIVEQPAAKTPEVVTQGAPPAPETTKTEQNGQSQAIAVREPDVLAPPPPEWERQLEPRSMREAQALSKFMHDSRMFSGYGTPAAVLSTVLAGRELGLQAVASLRAIHVVEGRHMLAADLLRGLVLRSGLAKFFRCTERSDTRATFVTHRKEDPEPISLTYTIEEGRKAFGFEETLTDKERAEKEGKWKRSGWGKNPADMLVARAGAKLARLVYPEVTHGLYCREEFDNGQQ